MVNRMINELAMRFIVGGTMITVISLLSKSRYPYISGLFMMFPAVTLIGYYFVSGSVTSAQMREITVYSLYSVLAVVVFIMSFYFFFNI
jgi:membrane protein GlpM